MGEWKAEEGMDPEIPQNENHTVDEEEPEDGDQYEDEWDEDDDPEDAESADE